MMSEKQLMHIPMAVYMGDQTALTRQIVKSYDDTETFDVTHYMDSEAEVELAMERGEVVFGLVIPKDFTKDLKKLKSPTILTIVDGTQLSTAAFTKIQSTEILLSTKAGAMINAFKGKFNMSTTEALNTVRPIEISTRLIGNPTRNYINFLIPGLMAALIQVGIVMSTASIVEARGLTSKEFRKDFIGKLVIYTLMGVASLLMMVGIQCGFFQVPIKGDVLGLVTLTFAFSGAVVSISMMVATLFKNKVFATQLAAVYFIPSSILSGYTWPLVAMPESIQKFATIMPFTYYGEFLRAWLLRGEFGDYTYNLTILVTMIVVGILGSFIIAGIYQKQVGQGDVVIEN